MTNHTNDDRFSVDPEVMHRLDLTLKALGPVTEQMVMRAMLVEFHKDPRNNLYSSLDKVLEDADIILCPSCLERILPESDNPSSCTCS